MTKVGSVRLWLHDYLSVNSNFLTVWQYWRVVSPPLLCSWCSMVLAAGGAGDSLQQQVQPCALSHDGNCSSKYTNAVFDYWETFNILTHNILQIICYSVIVYLESFNCSQAVQYKTPENLYWVIFRIKKFSSSHCFLSHFLNPVPSVTSCLLSLRHQT